MTDIKYDAAFEPVCMVSSTPSVITVGAKTPWKTFKELVEDAKKRPDQIVVGASLGSTSQYSIAIAGKAAGVTFKYVPYDGTAKRMNALLGGHIDVGDSNLTQKGKVDAGLLRFLANMSEKRTTGLEDVPTLKELGYDVDIFASTAASWCRRERRPAVIAKLNDACAKATKEPEFAKAMLLQGTEVLLSGPERLRGLPQEDRRADQGHRQGPRTAQARIMLSRDGISGLVCLADQRHPADADVRIAAGRDRSDRAGVLSARGAVDPDASQRDPDRARFPRDADCGRSRGSAGGRPAAELPAGARDLH